MKIKSVLLAAFCINILCSSFVFGQGPLSQLQGTKSYTPTRLEWLAVELNACCSIELTQANGYLITFIPIEKDDAIMIFVRYTSGANREAMKISIDSSREAIRLHAKNHGWDKWIHIQENIKIAETNGVY